MTRKLLALTALAAISPASFAVPLIDLEIGAGSWHQSTSGSIGSSNTNAGDIGIDDQNGNVFYATFEWPLPLLPNVKIKHTGLEVEGNSTLSSGFTFINETFTAGSPVAAKLDLSHTDLTLYYGLPEFYLDVDLGATLRFFDGEASATGTVGGAPSSESTNLSFVVPMAFADVRLNLPFTGLYAGVEGNLLSIGDNTLRDFTAKIGYTFDVIPFLADLELEGGFRSLDLELDADDVKADVTIDGPYFAVQVSF